MEEKEGKMGEEGRDGRWADGRRNLIYEAASRAKGLPLGENKNSFVCFAGRRSSASYFPFFSQRRTFATSRMETIKAKAKAFVDSLNNRLKDDGLFLYFFGALDSP